MKRVLVITYYWPPSGGAGVQRWLKFVKYLRVFGWEPVIYTPENPENPETDHSLEKDIPAGIEVIRQPIWEPYNLYKKFIGRKKEDKINAAFTSEKKQNRLLEKISIWVRGNFFIPDARKFWIKPSIKFLQTYLAAHPVDVIVSTGPPHSMHLIARAVSAKMGTPWVADFRDPWSNIDFYKDLNLTFWADRKHRKLEKKVLTDATLVTVVTNGYKDDFQKIVPRMYEVITNGFDPDDVQPSGDLVLDTKFSISHIGTLPASRNPETFWQALHELLGEIPSLKDDLEIKLVGKADFSVLQSAEKAGLEPYLRQIAYMPHDQVITFQQQTCVLLLIINNSPNAEIILPGKIFEYLAAGRPILCLGPGRSEAAEILKNTGAGLLADFGDTEKMKENLRILYVNYKNGVQHPENEGIKQYSRPELTRRMAELLHSIT